MIVSIFHASWPFSLHAHSSIDADEFTVKREEAITEILELPQETRSTTRQMLKQLPQYSLETLTLLRLYGDRAYALVAEDPEVVNVLSDQHAEEIQLLRRLRLAHARETTEMKESSMLAETRWNKIAKVSAFSRSGVVCLMVVTSELHPPLASPRCLR